MLNYLPCKLNVGFHLRTEAEPTSTSWSHWGVRRLGFHDSARLFYGTEPSVERFVDAVCLHKKTKHLMIFFFAVIKINIQTVYHMWK